MTKFNVVVVTAAGLLSGSAWAMSPLQPAAGQGPLFINAPALTSAAQRQSVEADAARHMPAAGELSARTNPAATSTRTRDEVREAMRQAIAHGLQIGVGERS